jgi:hypothetical protein
MQDSCFLFLMRKPNYYEAIHANQVVDHVGTL